MKTSLSGGQMCPLLLRPEVEKALAIASPPPSPDVKIIVHRTEHTTDPLMIGLYMMHASWLQSGRAVYDLGKGCIERLLSVETQWSPTNLCGVLRFPQTFPAIPPPNSNGERAGVIGIDGLYFAYVRLHTGNSTIGHLSILPMAVCKNSEHLWSGISSITENQPYNEQKKEVFDLVLNAIYAITHEKVGRVIPISLGMGERRKRQKAQQQVRARRLELPDSPWYTLASVRKNADPAPAPPDPPTPPDPAPATLIERASAIVPQHTGLRWVLENHCSQEEVLRAIDDDRYRERPGKPLLIAVPRPIRGYVRGDGRILRHVTHIVASK